MNDKEFYNLAIKLTSKSCITIGLAQMLEAEFDPYNDIGISNIEWEEIAAEIIRDKL